MADKEIEDPVLARFRKMSRPVRVVYARPRTFFAIAVGIAAAVISPVSLRLVTRLLVGWDVFVAVYLLLVVVMMLRCDHRHIRQSAILQDDGRFLIALTGISRFRIREELPLLEGYRRVVPEWREFAGDLRTEDEPGFDRDRLLRGLKAYFQHHQMQADWDAITSVPGERLVTSIAMICPFEPSEKQALLEAPDLEERARLLTAIVEMAALNQPQDGAGSARH